MDRETLGSEGRTNPSKFLSISTRVADEHDAMANVNVNECGMSMRMSLRMNSKNENDGNVWQIKLSIVKRATNLV